MTKGQAVFLMQSDPAIVERGEIGGHVTGPLDPFLGGTFPFNCLVPDCQVRFSSHLSLFIIGKSGIRLKILFELWGVVIITSLKPTGLPIYSLPITRVDNRCSHTRSHIPRGIRISLV